jgi:hypothetical protein
MNTLPPDRDDAAEGPVHELLWRLRARLVTPPTESRVEADLDRLFAAAREHAHELPVIRPTAPVAVAAPDELAPVVHLRGYRLVDRVGRVAAAFVLVAAVGSAVVLVPGEGPSRFPAITGTEADGRSAASPNTGGAQPGIDLTIDEADLGPEVEPGTDQAAGDSASHPSERDPVDTTGAGSPSTEPTTGGTSDTSPPPPSGSRTPAAAAPGPGPGPGGGTNPSAPPSTSPPASPSPSPQPSPSESPDGFDGFGGGRPCPPTSVKPAYGSDEQPDEGDTRPPTCPPEKGPEGSDDGDERTEDGEDADEAAPEGPGTAASEAQELHDQLPVRKPRG